jgi:mxaC protein
MNIAFDLPWLLPLALLALIPLRRPQGQVARYSSLAVLPRDLVSSALAWALRIAAAAAIVAVVLGLAGAHRPGQVVERVGTGAEIVLLLDRSRSMDQSLHMKGEAYHPLGAGPKGEAKGHAARRLLAQFAASRPQDRFGMVVFSAFPIRVLDFTQKPQVIQAAISAGNVGRGLSDTNIGRGLLTALEYFHDRPYAGSRVIMLVSDGGAHLDDDTQRAIMSEMRRERVGLYWIYIRSRNSPGLMAGKDVAPEIAETVPEHFLNEFFSHMGTPYRAYEAEDPEALARAIDDVNRLESFPIRYDEVLPRADLSGGLYVAAFCLAALLLAGAALEVRAWR